MSLLCPRGNDRTIKLCEYRLVQAPNIRVPLPTRERNDPVPENLQGLILRRFGRYTRPRSQNFALHWSRRKVGVSLKKKKNFFTFFLVFFLSAHYRQALMSVCSNYILFLFCLMLIVCVLSLFVKKIYIKCRNHELPLLPI